MEVALSVQNGVKDRLSIQYFNSNYNNGSGAWACCGGWLPQLAAFYAEEEKAIPWSNTNAGYADGGGTCYSSASMPAHHISTSPSYAITSITAETIPTYGLSPETAIANIKAVLNQNRAVWFAFFLADSSDWNNFRSFWLYSPESTIWNPDFTCGKTYNPTTGGGHAVLCVGYNDDDPDNRYWIIVNSWGTTSGRPNGIFHLDMDMNYSCTHAGGMGGQTFFWQTLDVAFAPDIPNVLGSYQLKGSIRFFDWAGNKWQVIQDGTLYITSQNDHKIAGYWQPSTELGWSDNISVKGYVGSFVRNSRGRIKNTPRLSLLLELGEYCQYPSPTYATYVLNAKVKMDKKTELVRSIRATINGWGEFGTPISDNTSSLGQFEGKFTAKLLPGGVPMPQGSMEMPEPGVPENGVVEVPGVEGTYPTKGYIRFYDWKGNRWTIVQTGTLHITSQDVHKIAGYWEPGVELGWSDNISVKGYVGSLVRNDRGKIKNSPRLSLVAELGTYCTYPSDTYATYILNAKVKMDRKTELVRSIRATINGWGEWGCAFSDNTSSLGQFEGRFTAKPIPTP
jgi:hypothetical protein